MTKIRTIQILRGTTAQNDAFTGSAGELTMDTTTNELRLHDGITTGGHIIGSGGGSGSGYHPDLFDVKWADHICNDAQWLRADTFSWQSGAVYQAAYEHLVLDIDGKTLQSETIAGTTIQFYLADDGHKICPASEESNVVSIYNATGVAWYYIIDTTNQRFKLPRTKFGFTGIRNSVGKFVEAGLPDHNHSITTYSSLYPWAGNAGTTWEGTKAATTGNASDSNPIYGNSDTVQPKATEMYLYFYVGNFTQAALENTAGITTEEMNNKVNIGHEVIEFQAPTAANNYTWYRKYRDGWIEQGGSGVSANVTITLPIPMADDHYTAPMPGTTTYSSTAGIGADAIVITKTTTTIKYGVMSAFGFTFDWQVSGMAA